MSNTITVNFIPCDPAPANGYNLQWRVAGSGDPYTDEGNFTSSPIIFTDSGNPDGTCYEGFIQSDCSESGASGANLGNQVMWSTPCEESGGTSDYTITLTESCTGGTTSNYLIEGGTIGDVVTVRAQFSGTIQKHSFNYTRAMIQIYSQHGTDDANETECFTDLSPHFFSIFAFTVVTMVATSELITVDARALNSSVGGTSVVVTITNVNGTPKNIFVNGCRGEQTVQGLC